MHHETHRGRYLFHPTTTRDMLASNAELTLTADLSHWRACGKLCASLFICLAPSRLKSLLHPHCSECV